MCPAAGYYQEENTAKICVRFFDYDGTLLKKEFVESGANATPPTPPTHDYLSFYGWNQSYINITRPRDIGAVYDTTDGNTHLFITVNQVTGLEPTLRLRKVDASEMTITWGDGSSETFSTTGNITKPHIYATDGDYHIIIESAGVYTFGQGSISTYIFYNYQNILTKILVGDNVTNIGLYGFFYCYSLEQISFSKNITQLYDYAFHSCYRLKAIIIPANVSQIGQYCFQLNVRVSVISLSDAISLINSYAFRDCRPVRSIQIPENVTEIKTYAFYNLYNLSEIGIHGPVTTIGASAFYGCSNLSEFPLLAELTTISGSALAACYRLEKFQLPEGVTSIPSDFIGNAWNLSEFVITRTTSVVTLAHVSAFSNINKLCKIFVPDDLVASYQAAANWVTYANYIYPLSTRPS